MRWNLSRFFLTLLLVVYGSLFLFLQRMGISENVQQQQQTTTQEQQQQQQFLRPFEKYDHHQTHNHHPDQDQHLIATIQKKEELGGERLVISPSNETLVVLPPVADWKNQLWEGRNLRDGKELGKKKNLWDGTDLPTWMKGTTYLLPVLLKKERL